jgi:hypothetical protein
MRDDVPKLGFTAFALSVGARLSSRLVIVAFVFGVAACTGERGQNGPLSIEASSHGDRVDNPMGERETTGEPPDENAESGGEFTPVVLPVVDPSIGNGLAVVGLYSFPSSGREEDRPRSTVGAVAGGTDNDSRLVGAGGSFHFDDDRYRVNVKGGYGNLNMDFYGLGGDGPLASNPVTFNFKGFFGESFAQIRIADNLYFGATGRYLGSKVKFSLPVEVLPTLEAEFTLASLGLILEYDTRDDAWFPVDGSHGVAVVSRYEGAIGSDAEFMNFDARYARYASPWSDLAVAGEVRVAHSGDGAPFFMLPFISIRGLPTGRYLDSTVAQVQGELRTTVWRRLGAVVFAGTGVVFPSLTSFEEGNAGYGLGAGLRYRLPGEDKINVGIDVAYGGEDPVVYFRVGEAF